jgi:uncharacterized protein
MSQDIITMVADAVRQQLAGQGAGHGFDHIERVLANARRINAEVGADSFIVELAALLHDVGDAKFHDGKERSGELSAVILRQFGVASEIIEEVVTIVDNISFRKRHTSTPLSLAGQVVQDADRLDALGAIGIVRTIEYGASLGQPFYQPENKDAKTGVAHFHEKLFKLRALMNTAAGKRLAEEREKFMYGFLEQLAAEHNASPEA